MYKIIDTKDGAVIGRTEAPLYIKIKVSTGCYIQTGAESAQGIAYRGTAYNLQGREPLGAEDTVILIETDAGTETDEISSALAENSTAIDNIIISMLEG